MRGLPILVVTLALLVPVSTPFAGLLTSLARSAGSAAKVERAAATAISLEKAGASASKAGITAERAAAALSADQRAAGLVREARELGLQRAKDGRFMLAAGAASARLVHRRVLGSVLESQPLVKRAADGRYVDIAGLDPMESMHLPGLVLVAQGRPTVNTNNTLIIAATQAMTDTIATAFRAAVFEVQALEDIARAKGGHDRPLPNKSAQLMALTKEVLRAMQDDAVLLEAQKVSVVRESGVGGASLWGVEAVYLFEKKNAPAALWIQMVDVPKQRQQGLRARVNLDEVLARIPKEGL